MITLKPPFRAENMEGLYNKVIKGQFSKIPEKFSNDLVELVKFLIQVNPENRPTPDQILKNPIIQKRMEFFKTYSEDMHVDNNLLQTIRIPKNLLFLTDRLPQANYNNNKKKGVDERKKKVNKNQGESGNVINLSKETNSNLNTIPVQNNQLENKKELSGNNINNNQIISIKKSGEVKKKEELKKNTNEGGNNEVGLLDYNDEENISNKIKAIEAANIVDKQDKKNIGMIVNENTGNNQSPKQVKNDYHDKEKQKEKEKYKEEKEKKLVNNKIYPINLNSPSYNHYGSQELLPNINRGGGGGNNNM